MVAAVLLLLLLAAIAGVAALDNGVGRTPPMGFNTWNHFGCNPTGALMIAQGDALIKAGMAAAGYVYVNIDDCWMLANRTKPWSDPTGVQIANPQRFPSGMKHLADALHQKGLRFGVYSARCRYTCQKFAASFGHEVADAAQWASWGVDYLKLDECYGGSDGNHTPGTPARTDGSCHDLDPDPLHRLGVMRDALNSSGRPIFFSNEFPAASQNYPGNTYNASWMIETHANDMGSHANMWRISQDIGASWRSILNNVDFDEPWAEFARPGAINDPDMLQVGNGDFNTDTEGARSHFALWCMLSAPLLAGNDLTKMTAYSQSILTHPGFIKIDQDPLVSQAVVAREGGAAPRRHLATDTNVVEKREQVALAPGFTGPVDGLAVPFGHRRCGTCCGANDTGSAMCRGSDLYGSFTELSLAQMAARCAADHECLGFAQDMSECGPTCFRPVSAISAISTTAGLPTTWKMYYKAALHPGPPRPTPGPSPSPGPPRPPPPPAPGPPWQVWKKHLADGSTAALLLNRGNVPRNVTAEFGDLGILGKAMVTDVWTNKSLGLMHGAFTVPLPPHASVTLILKPASPMAYKCDSVYQRQDGRFQRQYLQLECGLGTVITSAAFVPSCAAGDTVAGVEVLEAVGRSEQLTKCVGKRDCRVRLSPDAVRVEVAAAATCA